MFKLMLSVTSHNNYTWLQSRITNINVVKRTVSYGQDRVSRLPMFHRVRPTLWMNQNRTCQSSWSKALCPFNGHVSLYSSNYFACFRSVCIRFVSSESTHTDDLTADDGKQEQTREHIPTDSHIVEKSAERAVTDRDVDEELLRYEYENFELIPEEQEQVQAMSRKPLPITTDRGKTGVFDVEDLVALLEDENARDIRILPVPPECHYVDYLVVATGRSTRHLRAMAEFIKWMYKRKRAPHDPASVKIEGELCRDWFAMDLGNIAVHLFLHETRVHYDLETLWTIGDQPAADDDDVIGGEQPLQTGQREDFSFDEELDRLRRLRGSGGVRMKSSDDDGLELDKSSPSVRQIDSFGGWHRPPRD